MIEKRVFIAHAEADKPLVDLALQWLRQSDLHSAVFDDPSDWKAWKEADQFLRRTVSQTIQHADAVVLVWSENAAKSIWVHYEIGAARAFDIPIHVFLAGDSRIELPPGFTETEVVRLEPAAA